MRVGTICRGLTVTWSIWTFLHNCGFVKVKRKKKKNPGGCSVVNMCSQRLFCTEGTHSPLLAHTSAFPTQSCCTLILCQELPAVSLKCFWLHGDTSKCFRRVYLKKEKKKHRNDLIAVFYMWAEATSCFNMCHHSHWNLFFLLICQYVGLFFWPVQCNSCK